jgi:hypothetical protein
VEGADLLPLGHGGHCRSLHSALRAPVGMTNLFEVWRFDPSHPMQSARTMGPRCCGWRSYLMGPGGLFAVEDLDVGFGSAGDGCGYGEGFGVGGELDLLGVEELAVHLVGHLQGLIAYSL